MSLICQWFHPVFYHAISCIKTYCWGWEGDWWRWLMSSGLCYDTSWLSVNSPSMQMLPKYHQMSCVNHEKKRTFFFFRFSFLYHKRMIYQYLSSIYEDTLILRVATETFLSVLDYFRCILVWCMMIVVLSHQTSHLRLDFWLTSEWLRVELSTLPPKVYESIGGCLIVD